MASTPVFTVPDEFRVYVPEQLLLGLERYFNQRVPTGSFLRAVLENDLALAVKRADAYSLKALPHLIELIKGFAPEAAHGSPDRVATWLGKTMAQRAAEGTRVLDLFVEQRSVIELLADWWAQNGYTLPLSPNALLGEDDQPIGLRLSALATDLRLADEAERLDAVYHRQVALAAARSSRESSAALREFWDAYHASYPAPVPAEALQAARVIVERLLAVEAEPFTDAELAEVPAP